MCGEVSKPPYERPVFPLNTTLHSRQENGDSWNRTQGRYVYDPGINDTSAAVMVVHVDDMRLAQGRSAVTSGPGWSPGWRLETRLLP